jgi:fibrillarin-like pre-rRNA processing protein
MELPLRGEGMRNVHVDRHPELEGVYWLTLEDGSRRLATLNLDPGRSVYGERLVRVGKKEYRIWDAYRSKLAAAILKGAKPVPIHPGAKVLYLGSASGTTASHVSDIVAEDGAVYCVEFASRAMRELISSLCVNRRNVYPILEDARFPERYTRVVPGADSIYCDIAQPDQARILADNADLYLKKGSGSMLAIKSRSIDVTLSPSDVFEREIEVLRSRGFTVQSVVRLEPFDQDHAMVTAVYKARRR